MTEPNRTTLLILKELQSEVHANAVAHGWWDKPGKPGKRRRKRNFGELLLLCISELIEAFEEYRAGSGMTEIYFVEDKPEGIPVEISDCIIRLLDLCEWYGIDLDATIKLKHEYNKTRAYRHGGKKA